MEVALVVVGLLVIVGSTFAGAEWTSGSMTNQLLFEPRRSRVWLAKAGAVTIGCGLIALVALGGYWLSLGVIAQARDIAIPSNDVTKVLWHLLRAVALAMGAGLGAFALTMIFRHTVATLALLFVYAVGGEVALSLLPLEGEEPLDPAEQRGCDPAQPLLRPSSKIPYASRRACSARPQFPTLAAAASRSSEAAMTSKSAPEAASFHVSG